MGMAKGSDLPFAAQPLAKVCCTIIAAYVRAPALVLVPNLASKVKMVGFPDDGVLTRFCDEKSPPHKYNKNYLHCSRIFAASLLRFSQETAV
jgi:hypothetical protein